MVRDNKGFFKVIEVGITVNDYKIPAFCVDGCDLCV